MLQQRVVDSGCLVGLIARLKRGKVDTAGPALRLLQELAGNRRLHPAFVQAESVPVLLAVAQKRVAPKLVTRSLAVLRQLAASREAQVRLALAEVVF